MTLLPNILLILAALFVGAAVIAAVVSWRAGREARSTLFPIVREEETLRARRSRLAVFFLGALAALFLGGWLATLNLAGFERPPAADIAGLTPTEPSPVVLATEELASTQDTPSPAVPSPADTQAVSAPASTSSPSTTLPEPTFTPVAVVAVTPTSTATPTPTATPTSTATPTPTSVFAAAIALASKTRTPAPPGVQMGPIEFGTSVTDQVEAVNPSIVFSQDTRSIYATFPYSGMQKDLDFKAVWYQNGVEVMRDETKWQWGDQARSYSFLNTRGVGLYKLELYVNDSVLATGMFEIR